MSFFTSLSGLKAAQTDLSVISNNIANTGSKGFKKSRAVFGDLFAAAPTQSSKTVRSEEHTSELQSLTNLVCRLLLEKNNKTT